MAGVSPHMTAVTPLKVLLIEDNSGDADLVAERLSGSELGRFEVTRSMTLAEARGRLAHDAPDIVLVDLNLPDSSGLDTVRAIRRAGVRCAIVVLSGALSADLRKQAYAEGVEGLLSKDSHEVRDLARYLELAVERYRAHQERHVQALVDQSPDAVVVIDEEGLVRFANSAAGALFSEQAEALLGKPLPFPVDGTDDTEVEVRSAGGVRVLEVRLAEVPWFERPARLAALRDVTEQREMAEQLREAQKLEAIGRLAGGVAHDFNNLLTVIGACAELLALELPEGGSAPQLVSEMRGAVDRARTLTGQLLAFGRKAAVQPKRLVVNLLVGSLESMLGRLIGSHVELVVRLHPEVRDVLADASQLENALLNLAANARDAMPEGGRLTIETKNVVLGEDDVLAGGAGPGDYVAILVSDTGVGMDGATLDHVFEPFFTTKTATRGTGLGLASVHGFARQSGGEIRADSEPGHGSTFTILLPGLAPAGSTVAPARDASEHIGAGDETVLLVEDEEGVRRVAGKFLETLGYQVIQAADGRQGLEAFQTYAGSIDVLLADVVMPGGVSGPSLARTLVGRKPGLAVVTMSGHAEDAAVHHGLGERAVFVQKPFGRAELARAVRRALDRVRPAP